MKTVLLYKAENVYDLLLKKSILEENGINFILKNYDSQDLFGLGHNNSDFFSYTKPEIWVHGDDLDLAKELIGVL